MRSGIWKRFHMFTIPELAVFGTCSQAADEGCDMAGRRTGFGAVVVEEAGAIKTTRPNSDAYAARKLPAYRISESTT
jgi:hypothetical protein